AQHGIQQLAADGDYDLIVMATHGRSGLAHFIEGSITDEVLREAKFPVLCLHEGAVPVEKNVQIRRILCPLDFADDHLEAARSAGLLAQT
ncbi:MAG: universal stress protein, partial [Planctomycetota bacterium]|nr:universal stress protein [Planctomycetota bacterium]